MTTPTPQAAAPTEGGARDIEDLFARREGNPERIAELKDKYRAKVRGARLAEIRKAYDLTQEQLAEQLDISQKRVSRIERGDIDHTEVATVRRYIEALGGTVELVARFGDDSYTVSS
ncbi:XRE family transcriptional regulator [Rhodococcus sp. IEGM 1366]|uniref:helix-turn-helix domain-containing protein n=1 Tax=Rhodococcus TaxID=1827 RepID=UPI002954EA1B|nr:helix-turn-helix domain-containing protein [Rhodococcus sp. IEGM 1366]MDV8071400.1 XRE family transcriptional regulator [Rhodococcus sp. IEGM 1366]